jgi:hypothetical protein
MGRTDAEIFRGEDGARLTAIKEEVLRTRIESRTEVILTLKGATYHFNLLVEPLRDSGGQLVGILCSAIDITNLKETIARLQQALDEVQLLKGLLPSALPAKELRMSAKRGKSWRSIFRPTPEGEALEVLLGAAGEQEDFRWIFERPSLAIVLLSAFLRISTYNFGIPCILLNDATILRLAAGNSATSSLGSYHSFVN